MKLIDERCNTRITAKAKPANRTDNVSELSWNPSEQTPQLSEMTDGCPTQEWRVIAQSHRIGSLLQDLIKHNLSSELPILFNTSNRDHILYLHESLDSSYFP
jgi:hypothetical protein